jgi:hypothetical protein
MDDVRMGLLAVAGWLVAAVLMVVVSWSAIGVVRTAVVPGSAVATGLPTADETGSATARPTTPAPTTTRPPAAPAAVVVTGAGGTATVRCTGGVPAFVNLSPRQGWSVDRDDSPGEVKFDNPSGARTEIRVTCAGGTPRPVVEERAADGDDDGGSRGRGGGDDDD